MRLNTKLIVSAAAAPLLLLAGTALAQTTTDTGTLGTTTPAVPNTGAGGDLAANLTLLGTTGLAALAGGTYLARKRFAL